MTEGIPVPSNENRLRYDVNVVSLSCPQNLKYLGVNAVLRIYAFYDASSGFCSGLCLRALALSAAKSSCLVDTSHYCSIEVRPNSRGDYQGQGGAGYRGAMSQGILRM